VYHGYDPAMKVLIAAGIAALTALGIAGSAGASGPVASESGKTPLLIANCFKPKFKPADVIIACGDASFGARAMSWSSWTRKRADGTGTGQINDCDPDCVHGTTRSAPMELQLSKPQLCSNGKRVFAKLHYIWTSGPPVGATASGSVPMGCKLAAL
jgi:hypothetical protein